MYFSLIHITLLEYYNQLIYVLYTYATMTAKMLTTHIEWRMTDKQRVEHAAQ